jgi:hypothetical protein
MIILIYERQMHTLFCSKDLKGREHFEVLGLGRRIKTDGRE